MNLTWRVFNICCYKPSCNEVYGCVEVIDCKSADCDIDKTHTLKILFDNITAADSCIHTVMWNTNLFISEAIDILNKSKIQSLYLPDISNIDNGKILINANLKNLKIGCMNENQIKSFAEIIENNRAVKNETSSSPFSHPDERSHRDEKSELGANLQPEQSVKSNLTALENNTTLTNLTLCVDSEFKFIVDAINNNKTIQYLRLKFKSDQLSYLADMLKTNHTLEILTIEYAEMQYEDCKSMIDSINNNIYSKLNELCLNCISLDIECCKELSRISPNIETLYIGGCKITDEGLENLLVSLPNVKRLNLSSNRLTNKSADLIASFIRSNSHINMINLIANKINVDGCKIICDAMEDNYSLESVYFSYNEKYATKITDRNFTLHKNAIEKTKQFARNLELRCPDMDLDFLVESYFKKIRF